MQALEKKKLELEIIKLQAARAELEYKIMEREEDIQRIRDHITLNEEKIAEIKERLGD